MLKKFLLILFFIFSFSFLIPHSVQAQCSVCTRTAEQLGEKPAKGLNAGIIYLAFTPIVLIGVLFYNWWKREKQNSTEA